MYILNLKDKFLIGIVLFSGFLTYWSREFLMQIYSQFQAHKKDSVSRSDKRINVYFVSNKFFPLLVSNTHK